jgi:hypothetical protein
MYVQDRIEEYSDEVFKLLDGGAHVYFCGLKGMMPGIQGTLKKVAEQRGELGPEAVAAQEEEAVARGGLLGFDILRCYFRRAASRIERQEETQNNT